MKALFVEAIDTLFFRDGRPFEVGGEANLQIPPSPSTFYGALRSAIIAAHPGGLAAFESGKDGNLKKWIGERGDSEGQTARLWIKGPVFAENAAGNITRYFPLPRDMLIYSGKKEDKEQWFLVPLQLKSVPSNISSNMNLTNFLVNPYSQSAEYRNLLFSESLFFKYLNGDLYEPTEINFGDEVLYLDDIFVSDYREGIALKTRQKNVETSRLFTMQHMVLRSRGDRDLGFVFESELPDFFPSNNLMRLGGDGKVVQIYPVHINSFDRQAIRKRIDETKKFKVYLATPALFEVGATSRAMFNGCFDDLPGLKFKLIAAAISRAQMYGGYDIVANVPKVSFPAVPAGSVYYFELLEGSAEDVINAFHNKCISDFRQNQGFGYSFVGGITHV